jgi:hypothetical protein
MSWINNRQPLVTASAAVFTAATVARYARHIAKVGEPLIEAPTDARHTLLVHVENAFKLNVPDPNDGELPSSVGGSCTTTSPATNRRPLASRTVLRLARAL